MMQRRVLIAALAAPAVARAQDARPIRLIIPFPPGGATDVFGRRFAARLSAVLGVPVVPENRSGAAPAPVARAKARTTGK